MGCSETQYAESGGGRVCVRGEGGGYPNGVARVVGRKERDWFSMSVGCEVSETPNEGETIENDRPPPPLPAASRPPTWIRTTPRDYPTPISTIGGTGGILFDRRRRRDDDDDDVVLSFFFFFFLSAQCLSFFFGRRGIY